MASKVLVIGATGNVGRHVTSGLVAAGETVKAASRSATNVPGAAAVGFDFADRALVARAFEDVDRAFVLVPAGTTDVAGLLTPTFEAAAARKTKIVFMSVLGADADERSPYGTAEHLLRATGTPSVVLRPNWFMDNFHTYWLAGIKQGVLALPAGEGRSSFIDARDIAASAVAALRSDAFNGQAFNLTGPEALGYQDAAEILSRAAGRPIRYQSVTDDQFIDILVTAGLPKAYATFLAGIFYPVRQGWTAPLADGVQKLTGQTPRTLAAYAADYAQHFA